MIDPEDLIGLTEAAEIADTSGAAMRDAVTRGRLPAWRVGGVWVTTRSELAAYLASHHRRPAGWPKRKEGSHA